jgi:hypothetical protein
MYIPLTFEGALQKCLYASGGTEGFFVSGSQQWKFHWFTSSANFTIDKGSISDARIYVISGAGGGATGQVNSIGAGGGGGGGINSTSNAILYKGTYQIIVGKGGAGGSGTQSNGSSGVASSFIGQNINLSAAGGGGGTFGSGTTGGTSGNGFSGGISNSSNGGGGGGAFGTGSNATSTKAGNGGIGLSLQVSEAYVNPDTYSFGCGGGGYNAVSTNQPGVSCNGVNYGAGGDGTTNGSNGANYYGMGGGAGYTSAGDGGSGSVIIQYPITNYCANYFNRTGSCDCRQITFDASDAEDFYPTLTGSYFYMPCGGTSYVTGSLSAYAPITVCANSGSLFVGSSGQQGFELGYVTGSSLIWPQCSTGSLGYPEVCTSPAVFTSSCTSSLFTYFKPGGPGTAGYAYYVNRNSNTASYTLFTEIANKPSDKIGAYTCQSTIASNPSGSSSNVVRYDGAKCLILNYTETLSGPSFVQRLFWSDCAGTARSASFNFPGSVNYNFTASFALSSPYFTDSTGGGRQPDLNIVSVGNTYTGSGLPNCGCP